MSAAALFPIVYAELRRLAARYLDAEREGHTLQPTALVHEAYLRLAGSPAKEWNGRTHFFAVSARVMRQLLVDHARARGRNKRGGELQKVTLDPRFSPVDRDLDPETILSIDAAMVRLATLDPRQAEIVELRFFAGMTVEEIAEHLGVAKRTVESDWTHARVWLRRELSSDAQQR